MNAATGWGEGGAWYQACVEVSRRPGCEAVDGGVLEEEGCIPKQVWTYTPPCVHRRRGMHGMHDTPITTGVFHQRWELPGGIKVETQRQIHFRRRVQTLCFVLFCVCVCVHLRVFWLRVSLCLRGLQLDSSVEKHPRKQSVRGECLTDSQVGLH